MLNKKDLCYFCNEALYGDYKENVLKKLEEITLEVNSKNDNTNIITKYEKEVCILCLGLHQLVNNKKFLSDLDQKIINEKYEYNSFCFNFKLPLSLKIRQEYLKIFYKEEEKFITFDLKALIKECLNLVFQNVLKKELNADGDLKIHLLFSNQEDENLFFLKFRTKIGDKIYKKKKRFIKKRKKDSKQINYLTTNNMKQIIEDYSHEFLEKINIEELKLFTNNTKINTNLVSENLYISGRYLKYSRFLSQTPWEIEGKKIFESSVEEIIAHHFKEYFLPENHKFHSGGREDIDVRMLGNGRPFVVELINPKKRNNISKEDFINFENLINKINKDLVNKDNVQKMEIENLNTNGLEENLEMEKKNKDNHLKINDYVKVVDLKFTDSSCFEKLTHSANKKCKAYCCIIYHEKKIEKNSEIIKKLNHLKNIEVKQRTPLRVLHRRAPLIRDKIIHKIHLEYINDNYDLCFLLTSAGTYVKEFIHSDFNRTKPSLTSFFECYSDILQLDVLYLYEEFNEESEKHFNGLVKDYVGRI